MGIVRFFVKQNCWTREGPGRMIKTGNHVQQLPIVVVAGASVTEIRFVDLFALNRKRTMFGAIGPQATTIFVYVLVLGGLVHVPNAPITIRFLIQRHRRRAAVVRVLGRDPIGR